MRASEIRKGDRLVIKGHTVYTVITDAKPIGFDGEVTVVVEYADGNGSRVWYAEQDVPGIVRPS